VNNLGSLLQATGRLAEAEPLYRRALEGTERVLGPDHPNTLTFLENLGYLLEPTGRVAETEPLYRRALEGRERVLGPDHPDTLLSGTNLVFALRALDQPLAALEPGRVSLAGRLARSRSAAAGAADDTRAALGQDAEDTGRVVAQAAWEAVVQIDDGTVPQADQALVASPENQSAALRAEAFAAVQSGLGAAAEALERASARVAAGVAGLEDVVRDWERAHGERAALDRQITEFASNPPADPATRAALSATLAERRRTLDGAIAATEDRLRADYPQFFDLIAPDAVSVAELQGNAEGGALLGETEALVMLVPPEGNLPGLVWAVSRDGVAWAEIGMDEAELTAALGELHDLLDGGGGTRAPRFDTGQGTIADTPVRGFKRALAKDLHDTLFGDPAIQAVIAGKPDWILAPQGVLLSMPFAALVTDTPPGGIAGDANPAALRATSWLGLDRALSVVPAVSSVRALRRFAQTNTRQADLPFFGLGDPAFTGDPAENRSVALASADSFFRTPTADIESVRSLTRLPGTRTEIEALAAYFDAPPEAVLLDFDATETALVAASEDGRLPRARVVVLATHGLMAGAFDGLAEPALALTPPRCFAVPIDAVDGLVLPETASAEVCPVLNDSQLSVLNAAAVNGARIDDGLLTASEAARLNLDADWLILSACDTAAGADQAPDAEGLSGLARAFFYAGARTLLVSHWPVRDDVAERLTTDAVARSDAATGTAQMTRARAFQAAMRALIEDESQDNTGRSLAHPAAWAPFQVTGVQPLDN